MSRIPTVIFSFIVGVNVLAGEVELGDAGVGEGASTGRGR
jgi:hypothetical protein